MKQRTAEARRVSHVILLMLCTQRTSNNFISLNSSVFFKQKIIIAGSRDGQIAARKFASTNSVEFAEAFMLSLRVWLYCATTFFPQTLRTSCTCCFLTKSGIKILHVRKQKRNSTSFLANCTKMWNSPKHLAWTRPATQRLTELPEEYALLMALTAV